MFWITQCSKDTAEKRTEHLWQSAALSLNFYNQTAKHFPEGFSSVGFLQWASINTLKELIASEFYYRLLSPQLWMAKHLVLLLCASMTGNGICDDRIPRLGSFQITKSTAPQSSPPWNTPPLLGLYSNRLAIKYYIAFFSPAVGEKRI